MADQVFTYKKISTLPQVTTLATTDVFIVNSKNGTVTTTSKISFDDLVKLVLARVDLSGVNTQIATLNQTVSTLSTAVNKNTTDISNIITAGFNLIGIE